ncbi:hypothetical protein BJ878DRAFT_230251 [Calycina marina]|uniref:Uncharacterized protein n=1 Tax=Calycina marina TaxID=1763456 RepID=A0A9P7Z847_9HELO|nr:hypothetical protein BJ878DRAFT_230251 [Calycina marina]
MSTITGLGIRNKVKDAVPGRSKDSSSSSSAPKKEGWQGKVSGVTGKLGMGKGKDSGSEERIARPLGALKDPSAFGPPPKHVNYHGGAALQNQITPNRSELGAPIQRDEISARRAAEREEEQRQAEEAVRKPSVPYRADTTGLSTRNLLPPPGRSDGADGRTPTTSSPLQVPARGKPPGLPPRLPPRQNSGPVSSHPNSTPDQDAHKGIINQRTMDRLGAAGISVSAFGIEGRKPPLPPPSSSPTKPTPGQVGNASQLNELQSRFSHLNPSSTTPRSPSEGTTMAQKQEAFSTASAFRNDPSSVSLSDARAAASTANNFRERHGEQVQSGWQSANKLNTKYGISDKVGSYAAARPQTSEPGTPVTAVLGKKKPPPPMKKPNLSARLSSVGAPPPIPLSTRPKPGAYD